jgi:Flp pilus assembly protein TadG
LLTFVFFLVALLLVVGLVIDVGFAYVTRATLSKAVDAASLTGAKNLSLGEDEAEALARAAFFANYPHSGRDVANPDPKISFTKDADNNTRIDVSASAIINTFFIRILPQWKTMSVASSGEAVHIRVVMVLVLDRSGSMTVNGGAAALPGAVSGFIDNFDENADQAGLASFASTATLDMLIQHPFKEGIKNAVNNWPDRCIGRTFADGGLTSAQNAFKQVPVAESENAARVVVFFTDGYANTFRDTFSCPSGPAAYNLGASDPPYLSGALIDPTTGSETGCYTPNLDRAPPPCCPITTFNSIIPGPPVAVNWANVWTEGQLRALATAKALRTDEDAPVTIYAIGLGSELNRDFLKSIANDRSSPDFNPDQPEGGAVFASNADQLKPVFQLIAAKILLRLTR